jgi:putative Mg2+ transporter-C (MgtC) family protein
MLFWDELARLLLAMIAGSVVGLERERQDRPAGLRTHMLVAGGSALITLVSFHLSGSKVDGTRISAQIVTGIGFLGAGTIFRSGSNVRGLTTAAGLWVVAGIGMGLAAGGEAAYLALIMALVVAAVNRWVRVLENRLVRTHRDVLVRIDTPAGSLVDLFDCLQEHGIDAERVRAGRDEAQAGVVEVELRLRIPPELTQGSIAGWLAAQKGVREVEWL